MFAVKWPKFRLNISDLGDPLGVPPLKGEKICQGLRYTIMQNLTPIDVAARCRDIYNRTEKNTATNIPLYTNVWRVKKLELKLPPRLKSVAALPCENGVLNCKTFIH